MIEKLEHKIDEVLDYIINKPADRITPEDFAIMAGELRERRFRENSKQQRDKSAELLRSFMDCSPFGNDGV